MNLLGTIFTPLIEWIVTYYPVIGTIGAIIWITWKAIMLWNSTFKDIDNKFHKIDLRFTQLEGRFDELDHKITGIDQKLDHMEAKFDAKFDAQHAVNLQILSLLRGHRNDPPFKINYPDLEE